MLRPTYRKLKQIRDNKREQEHIGRTKQLLANVRTPVLLIIGARDGVEHHWLPYLRDKVVDVIGVEPDKAECERLLASGQFKAVLPHALGSHDGPAPFFVAAASGCSSCLEPDKEVLQAYPVQKWFVLKRQIQLDLIRFDTLYAKDPTIRPDFVQIDVQGFEYQVLSGFGSCLDSVTAIVAETHLKRLYKNQKVLSELTTFLETKGFMLRHIESQGPFEGEVVELNAYFVRRPNLRSPEQQAFAGFWEGVYRLPGAMRFADYDRPLPDENGSTF